MTSGEVSGEKRALFFEDVWISAKPILSSPSRAGVFFPSCSPRVNLRFEAAAVNSLSARLETPALLTLPAKDLGVKKRVNVRGVTVGFRLGLDLVEF